MMDDQLRSLFEAIAESAALVDKGGRIVEWNQGATTLFGYSKKEAVGCSLNMLYEQNYTFPKILQDTLAHQRKWAEETRFVRKNGIKGSCKTHIVLLHHPSTENKSVALVTHHNISTYKNTATTLENTIENFSHVFQTYSEFLHSTQLLLAKNIAAHEQSERNLRESELRFHLLAENSTDMIARHSPDGAYLYSSPACKTLLGYTPEELTGRSAYKYLHHDDIGKLKKIFMRRKDTSNVHTLTYRMRRKEGEYRWFESNIRLIREEKTKIVREIQCASRDVTDRIMDKKARLRGQQLAHVFRLNTMEEMASGMAHEISQPLAAIVNYTQGCVRYLEKDQRDSTQLKEIMQKAVAQAERAGEVIHRLKNFFCKGQVFKAPCKINSVIRETVGLIRNDLTKSKTKVDFELAKTIPLISVDKIQLQQVMLNLIQNAIEAMKEIDQRKRRIQIQTNTLENSIAITVNDSGPGFPKETINKVFNPFFTTKAHGRGMGLAICRSIIEAHGGQFTINPNTNNQHWIRFTLPIN